MNQILSLLFVILLNVTQQTNAQSKITISTADSIPFIAVWNNVQLNQMPSISITFHEDNPTKIPVQLTFPGYPSISVNQNLTIKDQMAITYELTFTKGVYKLIPAAETSYTSTPRNNTIDIANTTPVVIDTLVLNTQKNEAAEYDLLKTQIADQTFESRKLEAIQNYLVDHALTIEQLRYLMAQLSMEDRKLDLLKTAYPKMTDKSRLPEVTEEFLLDKNKAKAKEIITQ